MGSEIDGMLSLRGMGFARPQNIISRMMMVIYVLLLTKRVPWCCVGKQQTYAKKTPRPIFPFFCFVAVDATVVWQSCYPRFLG